MDVPNFNKNERNTLAVPSASDEMYKREANRWERLRQVNFFVEDIKSKWTNGDFFYVKKIIRVEAEEYVQESMQTIKVLPDFNRPSKRLKVINADRHASYQIDDEERVVEVEYAEVTGEEYKEENRRWRKMTTTQEQEEDQHKQGEER